MTLDQLPLFSWVRLGLGLLVFLGPGYLFLTLSPFRRELDRTFSLVASFGLSAALWAIFLSIANLVKVGLSPWLVIASFLICWIIAFWIRRPWQGQNGVLNFKKDSLYRIILWIVLSVTFIISLWFVRNQVAGAGSDSYHHTLFTQLIMDQGKIPEDYGPFTPVVTFTYHYGFHAATAFLGWVSGIPARLLVLAVGKILVILCAAAVALAAEKMTGSKAAGLTAAVVTAVVCVFPSYMLLWGRYTQLTGLTLMAIFMALFWVWVQGQLNWQAVAVLAVLTAGIGLTHYRVIAMTAVGVIVLTISYGLGRFNIAEWKMVVGRGVALAAAAFIGLAPWFFHLWSSSRVGYKVLSAPAETTYFSLLRLGQEALNYPSNSALLIAGGLTLLIGWLFRERIVVAMTFWAAIMWFPSEQVLLMDKVSVVISLFVPLSIVFGWGTSRLEKLSQKDFLPRAIKLGLVPTFLTILLFGGFWGLLSYPITFDGYLKQPDLKAIEFVKEQTAEDASFMINIHRFPFSDILMVGKDAGYWLPLLANRKTVVPPMVFSSERVNDPNFTDQLRQIEALGQQLTSPAGIEMLKNQKITHVFLGERGGGIHAIELINSPAFELIYQDSSVYIFRALWESP